MKLGRHGREQLAGGIEAAQGIDFLVCPAEALLERFLRNPEGAGPPLVRAISKHLARCPTCREEVDRRRRGLEASGARRPWPWAVSAIAALSMAAAIFIWHEVGGPLPLDAERAGIRPDPRIAGLATFEPPPAMRIATVMSSEPPGSAFSAEDTRQFLAAIESLEEGGYPDAARLMEDLATRHPLNPDLMLLLGFAHARSGDFEKAQWRYHLADDLGAGNAACWGVANACLRTGDVACARRELSGHILERDPEQEESRALLARISAPHLR